MFVLVLWHNSEFFTTSFLVCWLLLCCCCCYLLCKYACVIHIHFFFKIKASQLSYWHRENIYTFYRGKCIPFFDVRSFLLNHPSSSATLFDVNRDRFSPIWLRARINTFWNCSRHFRNIIIRTSKKSICSEITKYCRFTLFCSPSPPLLAKILATEKCKHRANQPEKKLRVYENFL